MDIKTIRGLAGIFIFATALFMLLLFNSALAANAAEMSALRLRTEYKTEPLGIDETSPRLSWILQSSGRAEKQSAYCIIVASSREILENQTGDLWDTGKVESDKTSMIVYQGKPLKSGQDCFWKVMVWDGDGRASGWSELARWSMGLLQPGAWQAKWIGFDSSRNSMNRQTYIAMTFLRRLTSKDGKVYLPSPHLRKSFEVTRPVKRVMAYATALGLYELYLNGNRVGNDFLTPGWTDYNKRVYYQTYDVTALIKQGGTNAIGAILADGWYAGNVADKGQRVYGSNLRLRAQLQIEYQDGSIQVVASDATWKAAYGPVREADIQAGENYDVRLEIPGWDKPGFNDSGWNPVDVTYCIDAAVQAYPGIPVRKTMEIKPISVNEPKPGVFVFNLSQNFAGRARLKVSGKAGDKVVLRFAEMLNPDGTIYTTNLRSARATDTYILKGGGEEIWEPSFTYHGFQYVEVTGYPVKPGLDAITGIVLQSELPVTGSFKTSSALVNKIYSNQMWSQRSNYFEVPTDCPQRDERAGWMGDAQAFIRTAAYNMDINAFFTKWMNDVVDAQKPDGNFPITAPAAYKGEAAGWGDAGIICPWTIYRFYGDTRMIEKYYDAMAKWMQFLENRSAGFISRPLGTYGDWLHINDPTPLDVITTAYFGYDAQLMAEMARAIGKEEDAKKFEAMHANIRDAFTKTFVNNGKIKGDSQTGYLMALRFGLLNENEQEPAAKRLLNRFEARNWYTSSGFLGVSILMPTLTQIGQNDLAYRLLNNTGFPSWGYEINLGATTIWERWNGYTKEKGFNTPTMNSFNHYTFGSVGEWLYSTVAGIDSDGPAFRKIVIHPQPGGSINWVKSEYDSINGVIASNWKMDGGVFSLDVTIPANTAATVYIPASNADAVKEGGVAAKDAIGVKFLRMENGCAVFQTGSGNYGFVAK